MACYKFTIGNEEFNVSSPNLGGDTNLSAFLNAVLNLKTTKPEEFEKLIKALKFSDNNVVKPDSRRSSEIPYLIQKNLQRSGVLLHVLNEEEWQQKCAELSEGRVIGVDPNAKSFFMDGEIYTRQNGFNTSDVMHELTHLLLAVMRGKDFKKYQEFIHTFYKHTKVLDIARSLNAAGTYSDNYKLDFEEEAIVRYLEGVFTGDEEYIPNLIVGDLEIDTMNYLDNAFIDVIKDTFGITNFPGVSTFFKSLIADVPVYGSDMFVVRPITSTGYTKAKKLAIESELIHALIGYYTSEEGGNLIKLTLC